MRNIKEKIAYRFRPQKEERDCIEEGRYITYGIVVEQRVKGEWQEIDYVPDVTMDYEEANKLALACTEGQLSPLHLMDVIEDMIFSI
ncbi:MAG: hypothetical protein J6R42_04065 [Clostridia bacterium]|nr:hypothetical protein [Clostridia bacterium]